MEVIIGILWAIVTIIAAKNIMGYTSRFERVILRAGAMLIFSVLFQFQRMSSEEDTSSVQFSFINCNWSQLFYYGSSQDSVQIRHRRRMFQKVLLYKWPSSRPPLIMEMSIPFTVIVPGQAPLTAFEFTNGFFHIDISNPQNVQYLTLVLTSPIPEGTGLSLHYSIPPYQSMSYIGAVSNGKPSDTFSTGWGMNPDVMNMQPQQTLVNGLPTITTSLKICVKPQSLNSLVDIEKTLKEDSRRTYARCVAQNLYNFMNSYSSDLSTINPYNSSNYMVVPQDFLDKWFKKFEEKFRRDPNFILKTTDQ